MCHSVGVSRTSPALVVTRFAARSMVKSGVLMVGASSPAARAAQRGAHPGQQLVHAERLGHVVVGAGIQSGHFLGLFGTGGQHDDRDGRPAAQPTNHVDAVDVRQTEVDDNQIRLPLGGEVQAGTTILGDLNVVAARLEVHPQRAAELGLVVDHQHGVHPAIVLVTSAKTPAVAIVTSRVWRPDAPSAPD